MTSWDQKNEKTKSCKNKGRFDDRVLKKMTVHMCVNKSLRFSFMDVKAESWNIEKVFIEEEDKNEGCNESDSKIHESW